MILMIDNGRRSATIADCVGRRLGGQPDADRTCRGTHR
jgi:hypothetical protein